LPAEAFFTRLELLERFMRDDSDWALELKTPAS